MKFGFECVISRNTGANWATPTWNPLELVQDATLSLDADEADVTVRGSSGWAQAEPTTRKAELTFQIMHDNANSDFTTLRDAFLNRTAMDMAVLDGAANAPGAQGLRAMWKVFRFSRSEALRDAVVYEVTMKPSFETTNIPVWMTVT
jgi:hypothetical protein